MPKRLPYGLPISVGIVFVAVGFVCSFACCTGLSCRTKSSDNTEIVLQEPLYFETRTVSSLRKANIPELLRLRLAMYNPLSHERSPVTLTLEMRDGSQVTVQTLEEYRREKANGLYAASNTDMKMEQYYFQKADFVLSLFERARPAESSYIPNPSIGMMDFDFLPAFLLIAGITSDERFDELPAPEDKSIGDVLKKKPSIVVTKGLNNVTFATKSDFFSLSEIARADFDGDGIEDILISKGYHVVGGSLGYASYHVLTRKNGESVLGLVKIGSR